ncbi:MAG: polysaccharide biosynthesis tyrosine autokinase, partial [Blastocatellia bacterium]|nr:polysaccharide biosynthesis tyrosine autokinase [Blastocatellia bacterium]
MTNTTVEAKDARTSGLENQLITLRQQLAQLKTEYTDEWADVIKVKKQIEAIENELKNSRKVATSTQMATLEQTYREAAAREKELRTNFEKQKAEVLAQNEAAINYRIIQQEIATNKSLLDSVLQRAKESDIILNGTTNNVHIVDRSLVPTAPAGPQRSKNVIIAFILSLMAGIGLSFLLTWLNDTVVSAEDLETETGLSVLGLIPATQPNFVKRILPAGLLGKSNGNGTTITDLEKFEHPIINESYLHLRTYLLLSTAGGPPQTVLVTSGQPGEGKTITAINLAKSLAQNGSKVLLIDADLRYPRIHSIVELSNNKGLTTLLTGKELNHEVIKEVVQKYPSGELEILTGGPKSPNPADILGSKEMRGLLNELKKHYDHIVIDSPPVLYFADSCIVSSFVEAVMIVVRCNQTSHQTIAQCKKRLQDVGAKIIG